MVLDYPFVRPLWNSAENSQLQGCKQSLTLSESTTCDGLCSALGDLIHAGSIGADRPTVARRSASAEFSGWNEAKGSH